MKLCFVVVLVFLLYPDSTLVAQVDDGFKCGNAGGLYDPLPFTTGVNDLTYTFDSDCEPLVLGVRFVFLTRGDGFGSFDPNSWRMGNWINSANSAWQSINDPNSCELSLTYNLEADVRIDLKGIHTIANTNAWNYRKAAKELSNYSHTSFCPSGIDSGNWPALKSEIDQFNSQHPETINFFFVENGDHLNFLKFHVDNQLPLTEPWPHYDDISIFSGCSKTASSYYSNNNIYIIEANLFTEYYLRLHFGHVYYPNEQHVPQTVLAESVFTGIGNHINHELGHSILNQGHSTCGCLNLMQGSNCGWKPFKNHLNSDQLTKLHKTLSSTNNKKYIDCNDITENHCDILVEEDVTLNASISVYGNLVIKSGNTLTVKSEIFLSDQSKIIVEEYAKLIVDNGKLTSLCSAWKGIRVYGGNTDFDVKFKNGAIIENTNVAAVSMFAPELWPQITQWGNGILKADNTTFNNTKRIAEFISWSPLPNPSYIRNCVQNGGKVSITNWNCQGIVVKGNVFNNITEHSIVSEHGSFFIEDNIFYSGENDILFNNTSAGIHTTVHSNKFYGTNNGYNARGTTLSQNVIWNNEFHTGFADIINDGENHYDIKENDITSVFGVLSFENGRSIADVHNNNFSENLVGILTKGENEDFNFYENCYSTTYVDNYIDGSVSSIIYNNDVGNIPLKPANNCFTHTGSYNSFIKDIGGNPSPFTYLEPDNEIIDCRNAILADPHVNRIQLEAVDSLPECGSNSQSSSSMTNYCWPDRWNKSELVVALNWLSSKISEIENNSTLTSAQKNQLKKVYNKCFQRVKGYLFEIYLDEEDYIAARGLFDAENSEEAIVFIYSSYIMENDLDEAKTYLNSIVSVSERMDDFITIQHINLDRIPYGPYYESSYSEINTVRAIALKDHSYAGFAKALYYSLTGEVIISEIPDLLLNLAESRGVINDPEPFKDIRIYPNPFNDYLNIDIQGYDEIQLDIFTLTGETVYSNKRNQVDSKISANTWEQGVYLIRIVSEGEVVFTEKFILIR